MNARERIMALRLQEKLTNHADYAEKIGVEVAIIQKEKKNVKSGK